MKKFRLTKGEAQEILDGIVAKEKKEPCLLCERYARNNSRRCHNCPLWKWEEYQLGKSVAKRLRNNDCILGLSVTGNANVRLGYEILDKAGWTWEWKEEGK